MLRLSFHIPKFPFRFEYSKEASSIFKNETRAFIKFFSPFINRNDPQCINNGRHTIQTSIIRRQRESIDCLKILSLKDDSGQFLVFVYPVLDRQVPGIYTFVLCKYRAYFLPCRECFNNCRQSKIHRILLRVFFFSYHLAASLSFLYCFKRLQSSTQNFHRSEISEIRIFGDFLRIVRSTRVLMGDSSMIPFLCSDQSAPVTVPTYNCRNQKHFPFNEKVNANAFRQMNIEQLSIIFPTQ